MLVAQDVLFFPLKEIEFNPIFDCTGCQFHSAEIEAQYFYMALEMDMQDLRVIQRDNFFQDFYTRFFDSMRSIASVSM